MQDQNYPSDQILQLAMEIGEVLYNHCEFDLSQQYYCYACELSASGQQILKQKVLQDERQNTHAYLNNRTSMNEQTVTNRHFFEAINNVTLREQLNNSSSTGGDLSETTDTSSVVELDDISKESFEIYMKRVYAYTKLNNYGPAITILKGLLSCKMLQDTMRIEVYVQLCDIFN